MICVLFIQVYNVKTIFHNITVANSDPPCGISYNKHFQIIMIDKYSDDNDDNVYPHVFVETG